MWVRLLHEWIQPNGDFDHIIQFLRVSGVETNKADLGGIKIFTEVALIRDAYFIRLPEVRAFMNDLTTLVAH